MTSLTFINMPTEKCRNLQNGGSDFYGLSPERKISDGYGIPCRHCQTDVPKDHEYLVLSYSPFPRPQPYAEVGPIFLCANGCTPQTNAHEMPEMFHKHGPFLLKAYNDANRIIYGLGTFIEANGIEAKARILLNKTDVNYLHLRSARSNCYWCRIEQM